MHIVAMIIARTRDCVGGSLLRQPEYRSDDKFVFAAVNHRLNAFGFLSSKDLQEVDKDGLSGNKCMWPKAAGAAALKYQRALGQASLQGSRSTARAELAGSWRGDLEFGI
ncbi:BZ3501_MvSof-1269-A2-R1_C33g00117 [Microbotryum saponariae]|nr:BZ3501_MvSof-1269-A2-R1_C33g00117 [Microbotryum saponariae]